MNPSIINSALRYLCAATLVAGAITSAASAHGAVLASYSNLENPNNNPLRPNDWGDFVEEPSLLTGAPGSGITKEANQFYAGWSSSISESKYLGFTLTPMDGYQITVTDISIRSRPLSTTIETSFVWGYRINEGAGFTAWNFGPTWTLATPNYTSPIAKTWDIPDFTTTGIVEFGFFASTPTASDLMEVRTLVMNGTMDPAAVPEPSTYALLGISATIALIAFRRRRTISR